jgi:hypothetical protein
MDVQREIRDSIFELKQKVDFNQKLDVIFVYKRVFVKRIMQTKKQETLKTNGILIRKRCR